MYSCYEFVMDRFFPVFTEILTLHNEMADPVKHVRQLMFIEFTILNLLTVSSWFSG